MKLVTDKLEHIEDVPIEYPIIEGMDVPKSFWDGLREHKTNNWVKLPLKTRNDIDAFTVSKAISFLNSQRYDGYHYGYFSQYRGHEYALQRGFQIVLQERYEEIIWAWNDRLDQIESGKKVPCGARRKNGVQCKAYAVQGRNRCKHHGGMNTGPKTIEGKLKALSVLTQYRKRPELLEAKRQELMNAA